MSTPTHLDQTLSKAKKSLLAMLADKKKISRKIFKSILREQRKNKNRRFAIATLYFIEPICRSESEVISLLNIMAKRISECDEDDFDLIHFLSGHHKCPITRSFCVLWKYKMKQHWFDLGLFYEYLDQVDQYRLRHYLLKPVPKHPSKCVRKKLHDVDV